MNLKTILKQIPGFTLVELLIVVAIIGLLAAVCMPPPIAHAQSSPTLSRVPRWNRLGYGAAVATNTTATTFVYGATNYNNSSDGTTIIPIYAGRGMSFFAQFADGVGTNGVGTWGIDLTYDGTNWTSDEPIQFTMTCNSSNVITHSTNILADQFDNAKYARLGTFKGGTANNSITNNWLAWVVDP